MPAASQVDALIIAILKKTVAGGELIERARSAPPVTQAGG
jgi:hypothetical protein